MTGSDLTFASGYWADDRARAAFCDLAREVFALDFSAWEDAGCWDDDYRPFTCFDRDGRAVSNACLYSLPLVVSGRRVIAGQLSAVATRPEWRRRGLARSAAQAALEWSEACGHAFAFLFADEIAFPLYRSLGFRPWREHVTCVQVRGRDARLGARRLDPANADDRTLLWHAARERSPVSHRLGALGDRLWMFHALIPLRESVWRVDPLDVVVLVRRDGAELTLLDVVGREVPPLVELYPYLAARTDERVTLRFETDRMGDLAAIGDVSERPLIGNNLHVRGMFPLREPVVFPITAQA